MIYSLILYVPKIYFLFYGVYNPWLSALYTMFEFYYIFIIIFLLFHVADDLPDLRSFLLTFSQKL